MIEKYESCTLCGEPGATLFHEQESGVPWHLYFQSAAKSVSERRSLLFFRCDECGLIFKDPVILPSEEQERTFYANHQNSLNDQNYLTFLNRLAVPLIAKLKPADQGLDFGCGPTKGLEKIFRAAGFECDSYDVFFHQRKEALEISYDFISCSEVVEHFHEPMNEFKLLFEKLLKPGGWLGIMTSFAPDSSDQFAKWHYHVDPTHVSFYSPQVFAWIASKWGLKLEIPLSRNVVLFNSPSS